MIAIRIGMALHAVAALAYWIAQPRGFEVASRSFVEHQVVAPILFAVSAAGTAALILNRRWTVWISVGILSGYWILSSAVIAVLGSTLASRIFWPGLIVSIGILILAFRRVRPEPPALLTGGTVGGAALAVLFWACTWAPPATTRPRGGDLFPSVAVPGPSSFEEGGIDISILGHRVVVKSGSKTAVLWSGFEYDAVSDDGLWSLFQFRSTATPPWTCGRSEQGGLDLRAENEDFLSAARVWVDKGAVRLRCETRVKRELASHLSSVMQLQLRGDASVNEVPWRLGNSDAQCEFVALRHGRTEFLRASSREKGPFETLGSWEIRDPQLTIDGWKVQVHGWADQGSRAPSPTAGWGVSQAAIERADNVYMWSLASTSIGRGWHTVRTAPGVYVLEAVVTPP